MRGIKFRGKRVDNGEWIIGDLVTVAHKHFIDDDIDKERVDPATVGQFTGLKDKDGAEIYEMDIVCFKIVLDEPIPEGFEECMEIIKPVIFVGGAFVVDISFLGAEQDYILISNAEELVVVGDIHDNPELLKED